MTTTFTIASGTYATMTTLQEDPGGVGTDPIYFDVLANAGTLTLAAGDSVAFGTINGTGTISMHPGALLRAEGVVDNNQKINFVSTGGAVQFDNPGVSGPYSPNLVIGGYLYGDSVLFTTSEYPCSSDLTSGTSSWLSKGWFSYSTDGAYVLAMQSDGNLVMRRRSDYTVLWQSNTAYNPSDCKAVMQTDGNFVVYHWVSGAWSAVWSSNTVATCTSAICRMETTGVVNVYHEVNGVWTVVWHGP